MKKMAEQDFLRYNGINSKAGTEKAALGRGGSDGGGNAGYLVSTQNTATVL